MKKEKPSGQRVFRDQKREREKKREKEKKRKENVIKLVGF